MRPSSDQLLRVALRTDAVGCAVFSLAVIFILLKRDSWLTDLGVSVAFVSAVGVVAFAGAPLLWSMSRRREISHARVWPVIAANLAWAIFCIIAYMAGWVAPSTAGTVIIVSQAVITAAIAEFEWVALRGASVQRESAT